MAADDIKGKGNGWAHVYKLDLYLASDFLTVKSCYSWSHETYIVMNYMVEMLLSKVNQVNDVEHFL